MTEDEARAWLGEQFDVPRETWAKLQALVEHTLTENSAQNLIAASTAEHIWNRHIADSAQLLKLSPARDGALWIDLGSGAGFPGIVVALLAPWKVHLVEVRRRRAEHLASLCHHLDIERQVTEHRSRVETLQIDPAAVISARAYAPLDRLLDSALHLSTENTMWILPKGRYAASELEASRGTWQGEFRVEPSVTDSESSIIVASGVERRRKT
jgi:16S rRNA (guanine527-N7)-methyltransferase